MSPDPTLTQEIVDFLNKEAQALDDGDYRAWLGMLTDDVVYQVPIRVTRERGDDGSGVTGVVENMFHLDEERDSLEMRVERIETGFAWAEDPPSRLRHFVTNVRVEEAAAEGTVKVRSNVLVYRSRGDQPTYDLLSGERFDTLRKVNGAWKLARRKVILDSTTLPTLNLSFFF